jgi:hypothetical protein
VRGRGGTSRGDRSLQRQSRGGVCKVPGGRSPQISPGRESSLGMVHGEGYRDPKGALSLFQVLRDGTNTSNLRDHCGPRTPVLQMRRKRTSCQRLVPEALHPSAPCASRHPPTTGFAGRHAPPPPRKSRGSDPSVRQVMKRVKEASQKAAVNGREEAMELAQ